MSRLAAFQALLALGQSITPPGASAWGDTDRRWKDYTKTPLPSLWQLETDADYKSGDHGQMMRRYLQVYWAVIHGVGKDQGAIPADATAAFLDAVDAKLCNPKIGRQTLNGNCYAAYVSGTVRRYPGDGDGIEILAIPIIVELP